MAQVGFSFARDGISHVGIFVIFFLKKHTEKKRWRIY